ncbi:MAG: GAF domain-containing protein [Acidimicrobiia bacterium]|nr:GAF domain-containing protein [Acidimicrobiia bacterium]NNC74725.1 GAF domain-containing protein [Acidimicrobiia bacterium]
MTDIRVDHQRRVTWVGILLSWAGAAAFIVTTMRDAAFDDVWVPIAIVGGSALIVTVLPWRRLHRTVFGPPLVALWAVAAVYGIIESQELRSDGPLLVAFAAVVVFGAAMMLPFAHQLVVVTISAVGYLVSLTYIDGLDWQELAVRLIGFGAIAILALLLSRSVEGRVGRANDRFSELQEREIELEQKGRELDHVYEVSRTIGTAENLAEVLPELVGRVVDAVDAKVGLVMLYHPENEVLEVVSPIWVAGHSLRAEGYEVPLTSRGIAPRVFISGEAAVDNSVASSTSDPLLIDLDAQMVAAVPLRIESRPTGVLMVADKNEGVFDQDDLETLESLAAPSALVLNQMSRFEAVQEAGEKMAELAQLKTDFVSVVSHELRTPLTSIIGSLKTLGRPELAPTDPNARELLNAAANQADRLRSLIEDLLVVSRLDNRALPVRPETIEVRRFVTDVTSAILGSERRVMVDVAAEVEKVEADPEHLRRILTNLVVNAMKYAPGSSIEVLGRASEDEVTLSVVDHGPGIPYELQEHVFDRFTQIERPETRARGGTGLGLSIVRGLAEAMGGKVWFEPTMGGGATFAISLPKKARAYQARNVEQETAEGL